jgi:hypothetical protein
MITASALSWNWVCKYINGIMIFLGGSSAMLCYVVFRVPDDGKKSASPIIPTLLYSSQFVLMATNTAQTNQLQGADSLRS